MTEVCYGNFRAISALTKHRLTTEYGSYNHAIDSTHQLVIYPDFQRVGVTEAVELVIGSNHCWNNPSAGVSGAGRGTGIYHALKCLVNTYLIVLLAKAAAQAFRYM
jgi:hypothetical protein